MTTSELMKAMSDAGAPFEAILIAIQALDAKDAEIAERDREQAEKRAKDAERKRLDRAAGKTYRRRPRTVHGRSQDCPADPPIDNNHTPPVSSNDETTRTAKPKKSPPAKLTAKPDDVTEPTWRDFSALRRRKGGPISETALAGIREEAMKAGWTLEAALKKCVTRNWQGFEAHWLGETQAAQPAQNDDFMSHLARKSQTVPSA